MGESLRTEPENRTGKNRTGNSFDNPIGLKQLEKKY